MSDEFDISVKEWMALNGLSIDNPEVAVLESLETLACNPLMLNSDIRIEDNRVLFEVKETWPLDNPQEFNAIWHPDGTVELTDD